MYFIFMLESIYPNNRIVMGVSYISKINIISLVDLDSQFLPCDLVHWQPKQGVKAVVNQLCQISLVEPSDSFQLGYFVYHLGEDYFFLRSVDYCVTSDQHFKWVQQGG